MEALVQENLEVFVRDALASDVVKCYDMWQALVKAEAATFPEGAAYPAPNLQDPNVIGAWFRRFTSALSDPDSRFFVAEVDGSIKGFVLCHHYLRELGEPQQFIQCGEMYIEPAFRGGAVYEALEGAVEGWAAERQVDMLECAAVATDPQVGRWQSRGFIPYMVNMYRPAKWRKEQ